MIVEEKKRREVLREAVGVRRALSEPGVPAAARLLAFAEVYAASTTLRDEAVLLQLDAAACPPDALDELSQRMLALLQAIVEEHTRGSGTQTLADRDRLMVNLREHFQRNSPAHEEVVEARGIMKRYHSDFTLQPFDLTLRLGEITGVVGQNAHGKTTLLRLIAGELQADGGSLSYPMFQEHAGTIRWPVVRRHIAFVPQELPPWFGMLRDTLHYEASMHGVYREANERNVNFIVERLGLSEHMNKRWNQLSGGFKVRFALARALVWKPRLLVLDEPLANLDVKAKGLLLQDLRDLGRSYSHPIAVIMSSHDLHNLEAVCSQMVFLKAGKVDFIGDVGDLGSGGKHSEFEVGSFMSLQTLRERLAQETFIHEVREDGLNFVIVTEGECTSATVLAALARHDVEVSYFRNSSRSIRRLFD